MVAPFRTSFVARLALALALVVLPLAGRADEPGLLPAGSSFHKTFSNRTRDQLAREVPLVAIKDARVVMANHTELARLGLDTPPSGLQDSGYESRLLRSFAFRPATPDEIQAGSYTHVGIGTRYADNIHHMEGVKGDGRAALTGDVVIKDRTGRITGIYDIQVKGVATGLHAKTWGFDHTHGKESLRQALEDALFSDYLAKNGVRTNRWLAVIDTGQTINYPDGGKEHAGLLVRGGSFWRLAHLNLVRNDPKTLRELVDFTNRQVSMELGRSRPLSMPGLFKVLCQRKARELADLYFLRTVHGSITYDNIGLMETMDHGTASTVDRTHKNYSFFRCSKGYGHEPREVMSHYYERELYNLLMAAASGTEKTQLRKLKPGRIATGMLESQMTYNLLLHSGFSDKDARWIMKHRRAEARSLYRVFDEIANVTDSGAKHTMGARTEVKDPARYDVLTALGKLAVVQLGRRSAEGRQRALLPVLRPGIANDTDRARAAKLVEVFDKVAAPVLARYGRREQAGLVRTMRDSATQRNRFVSDLVRDNLRTYAGAIMLRIKGGESLETIRADINAFRRHNEIKGPGTATHAAAQVLAGKAERTADGKLVLARHRENGVAIEQLSDGSKDVLRVSVAGDPLQLANLGRYRMRCRLDGGGWKDLSPARVEGNKAIFELPVVAAGKSAPRAFSASFFDVDGKASRWWNNGGRDFGRNVQLVFGTAPVHAALAVEAKRRGNERTGLRASLKAYGEALYREEGRGRRPAVASERRTPRHQRALQRLLEQGSVEGVRGYRLRPRKERKPKPVSYKSHKTRAAAAARARPAASWGRDAVGTSIPKNHPNMRARAARRRP